MDEQGVRFGCYDDVHHDTTQYHAIIILYVIHLKACRACSAAYSVYTNCQFVSGPNCSNRIGKMFFF